MFLGAFSSQNPLFWLAPQGGLRCFYWFLKCKIYYLPLDVPGRTSSNTQEKVFEQSSTGDNCMTTAWNCHFDSYLSAVSFLHNNSFVILHQHGPNVPHFSLSCINRCQDSLNPHEEQSRAERREEEKQTPTTTHQQPSQNNKKKRINTSVVSVLLVVLCSFLLWNALNRCWHIRPGSYFLFFNPPAQIPAAEPNAQSEFNHSGVRRRILIWRATVNWTFITWSSLNAKYFLSYWWVNCIIYSIRFTHTQLNSESSTLTQIDILSLAIDLDVLNDVLWASTY